jgi:hypothetical protein
MMAIQNEEAIRVLAEVRRNKKPPAEESDEMRALRSSIELAFHYKTEGLQEIATQWLTEDEYND